MTTYTATYSPEDNKLRLYASSRLDSETYERAKACGFRWAPKQDLFFTTWSPGAEDFALELAGEIEDEDSSLVDRAEERAERFAEYSEHRTRDATAAAAAVEAIAANIPIGQPILVGHHSERRARKDAERIENGMRRAVKMWETAEYWQSRAAGAISHAKYKELPSVRARRIKTLEAEQRKYARATAEATKFLTMWRKIGDPNAFKRNGEPVSERDAAMFIANHDHVSRPFPLDEFPRQLPASQYEGQMSLWSALDGNVIDARQAAEIAIRVHQRGNERRARWLAHYDNRLTYERAMLAGAGGTIADRTGPEKGGAVRCWASPRGGWSYIQKVNKVSVSVLDNWGNGGRNFSRTIELDKLQAVMTAAEVADARAAGRLVESNDGTGFFLREPPAPMADDEPPEVAESAIPAVEKTRETVAAMRETLRHGVKVVAAPQLFPTPPDLARRMVEAARIAPHHRVLEPSAGTGALLEAIGRGRPLAEVCAIEINPDLATALRGAYSGSGTIHVHRGDFLDFEPDAGGFDRIVMNPPFADGQDVRHVTHALRFLRPGGRLVAVMSAGVTFREDRAARDFRGLVLDHTGRVEPLPDGTFKTSGTDVRAVLVTLDAPDQP